MAILGVRWMLVVVARLLLRVALQRRVFAVILLGWSTRTLKSISNAS